MTRLLHVAGLVTTLISPDRHLRSGVEMVLEAADATDYRAALAGGPVEFHAVQERAVGACRAGLQACHQPRRQR